MLYEVITGMLFLFLHLSHGVGSFFQSLGLTSEATLDKIGALGKVVAFVVITSYSIHYTKLYDSSRMDSL